MIIIISIAIVCGAAMLYCVCNKRIKTNEIIAAVFWISVLVVMGLSEPTKPEDYTPEAKASLIRKYHVTPEQLYQEQINRTPLEKAGFLMIITFLVILMLYRTIADDLNEKEIKKLRLKYLAVFLGVLFYLLSLYAGIQLMLIPYLKKKKEPEPNVNTVVQ